MKIKLHSVFVDDQEKALKFYTEVLGFVKKTEIPAGQFKWLTVISPEGPDDLELVLEPDDNPATKIFKNAIYAQNIPFTAFAVDDIYLEFYRLKNLGVAFTMDPTPMDKVTIAVFDDTCGNQIQLYQVL